MTAYKPFLTHHLLLEPSVLLRVKNFKKSKSLGERYIHFSLHPHFLSLSLSSSSLRRTLAMDLMRHSSAFLLPSIPDDGPPPTYALVVLNQRLPRFTPLVWKHGTCPIPFFFSFFFSSFRFWLRLCLVAEKVVKKEKEIWNFGTGNSTGTCYDFWDSFFLFGVCWLFFCVVYWKLNGLLGLWLWLHYGVFV